MEVESMQMLRQHKPFVDEDGGVRSLAAHTLHHFNRRKGRDYYSMGAG